MNRDALPGADGLLAAAAAYIEKDRARFHTPGHKGRAVNSRWGALSAWDLTECDGLDSLYHPAADGPILAMERGYAALYGAAHSFAAAGGATLCIQAMLALALRPGQRLLIGRGAHKAAIGAMALLDIRPRWLLPPVDAATGLAEAVAPAQVEQALAAYGDIAAVYITSPSYFGVVGDIAGVAAVCRRYGVPLLVDNAHGAHLPFIGSNGGLRRPPRPAAAHPIALGADMCCDSLHKTLPVLTGGALLHVGNAAYTGRAREKLALFGSTSPGYPVLLSMDSALQSLLADGPRDIAFACARMREIGVLARARGFLLPDGVTDPLRLTLSAAPLGCGGAELAAHLRENGVEPELVTRRLCVLLASGYSTDRDFKRLEAAVASLPAKGPLPGERPPAISLPEQALPPREAVFAASVSVPLEEAVGRVSASLVAPCPPGVALAVPGEKINSQTRSLLKDYGICSINVVQ